MSEPFDASVHSKNALAVADGIELLSPLAFLPGEKANKEKDPIMQIIVSGPSDGSSFPTVTAVNAVLREVDDL